MASGRLRLQLLDLVQLQVQSPPVIGIATPVQRRAQVARCFARTQQQLSPPKQRCKGWTQSAAMGSFSFTTNIKEDRTLQLPAGTPIGRVIVAITPADKAPPAGAGGVIGVGRWMDAL